MQLQVSKQSREDRPLPPQPISIPLLPPSNQVGTVGRRAANGKAVRLKHHRHHRGPSRSSHPPHHPSPALRWHVLVEPMMAQPTFVIAAAARASSSSSPGAGSIMAQPQGFAISAADETHPPPPPSPLLAGPYEADDGTADLRRFRRRRRLLLLSGRGTDNGTATTSLLRRPCSYPGVGAGLATFIVAAAAGHASPPSLLEWTRGLKVPSAAAAAHAPPSPERGASNLRRCRRPPYSPSFPKSGGGGWQREAAEAGGGSGGSEWQNRAAAAGAAVAKGGGGGRTRDQEAAATEAVIFSW
jgi:hypothetical protein